MRRSPTALKYASAPPLEGVKTCTGCEASKPLSEFNRDKYKLSKTTSNCKECLKRKALAAKSNPAALERYRTAAREKYRRTDPAKRKAKGRAMWIKMRYGLTMAQFEAMSAMQGGVCAICKRPPGRRSLAIDHCHTDGAIRGLLCDKCNRAIGLLHESPDVLLTAVQYLTRHLSAHVAEQRPAPGGEPLPVPDRTHSEQHSEPSRDPAA